MFSHRTLPALLPALLLGCNNGESDCLLLDLVDYEIDAPAEIQLAFTATSCSGAPVGAIAPEALTLYEDGAPLNPYESQVALGDADEVFSFRSVLLLDVSGSVLTSGTLPALQRAAADYLATIGDSHRVALGVFDGRREVEWLTGFTDSDDALLEAIIDLSDREVVDSATNLYGAVLSGLDGLDGLDELDWLAGSMTIFTDGVHSVGSGDGYPGYQELVSGLESSEHAVYAVGLGQSIDYDALSAIGRDGFVAPASDADLSAAFAEVAGQITTRAESHHVLRYCSPARAGEHTLTVEATSAQGLTGALNFQFDAAGFHGGCATSD